MEDGLSRLRLPASHISDGRVRASHIEDSANNGIRTIGRWGDVVTFDQLPDSVRTRSAVLSEALTSRICFARSGPAEVPTKGRMRTSCFGGIRSMRLWALLGEDGDGG